MDDQDALVRGDPIAGKPLFNRPGLEVEHVTFVLLVSHMESAIVDCQTGDKNPLNVRFEIRVDLDSVDHGLPKLLARILILRFDPALASIRIGCHVLHAIVDHRGHRLRTGPFRPRLACSNRQQQQTQQ